MIDLRVDLCEVLRRVTKALEDIFALTIVAAIAAGCAMSRPIPIQPVCDSEGVLKGYSSLLETMTISKYQNEVSQMVEFIILNKPRYQNVEDGARVSKVLVAAIHAREASLSFEANILNGEPLDRKTEKVPKGRGPWPTWELAAIEAMEDLSRMGIARDLLNPSPAQMACILEHYNGLGYKNLKVNSPYLWSGTNHYSKGSFREVRFFKLFGPYVSRYYPDGEDSQVGAMPVILKLLESELAWPREQVTVR